ncbi:MAG: SUF system NifU family Fe-S cluster assembly protein [Firmicutes bacterium]|nr:SUF system NifU family Fe-S cluster assembly protein [Bacillota bacterium]
MNQELKRSVILEHYQHPKNRGLIEDEGYIKINMNNESCIDEIDLTLMVKDDKIHDITFDGEACAICISSTSIMIDTLIGKTIEEAKVIIKNYYNMINEQDYDSDVLEQAIVYDDIYRQPNRKKCALLSWWGVEKILKELEQYGKQ